MNLDDLKEHGGPAFPTHRLEWNYGSEDRELATKHSGMSVRDFFATHAPAVPEDFGWIDGETDCVQRIVRWNWCYADAMLAARGSQ
jgi:hypothetical protein